MIRLLVAFLGVAALGGALLLPAGADNHEGTVNAFVTPQVVSISINNTTLQYGSLQVGTLDARPDPTGFTVTNNGTLTVSLEIKGAHSRNVSDDLQGWTLGASPGSETYVHRFSIMTNPAPHEFNPLGTAFDPFISGVTSGNNVSVKLSLHMPTSTTKLGEQRLPVTVRAFVP
jgi:hypothetical protein